MIAAAKIASAPIGDPVLSQGIGASRQMWLAPVIGGLRRALQVARQLGPYAAIELILPGGSLLAIVLWLYRRSRLARGAGGTVAQQHGAGAEARPHAMDLCGQYPCQW